MHSFQFHMCIGQTAPGVCNVRRWEAENLAEFSLCVSLVCRLPCWCLLLLFVCLHRVHNICIILVFAFSDLVYPWSAWPVALSWPPSPFSFPFYIVCPICGINLLETSWDSPFPEPIINTGVGGLTRWAPSCLFPCRLYVSALLLLYSPWLCAACYVSCVVASLVV